MEKFNEYIQSKTKRELEEELLELYTSFKTVREHYTFKWSGDKLKSKNLQNYKTKISRALNPDDNWDGGFNTEKTDKILARLKSESNIKYNLEIGLYAINECTELANVYGGDYGDDFYEYFIELYRDITEQVWRRGLDEEYRETLKTLMEEAFEGYGYRDDLQEIYKDYF